MTDSSVPLPKCYIFKTKEDALKSFPGQTIKEAIISDPSYEQSFKSVLSTDEDKQQFLMSMLNSLYFPSAGPNDVMIREVEARGGEWCIFGEKTDVACRCYCYAKNAQEEEPQQRKAFEFGIQRTSGLSFSQTYLDYGYTVHVKNFVQIRVLGLLNLTPPKSSEDPFVDQTSCFALLEIDNRTNYPVERSNTKNALVKVNEIDLRVFRDSDELAFGGEQLGVMGITWLKLFGVRQWAMPLADEPWRFRIFYPERIDPLIERIIVLLASFNLPRFENSLEQFHSESDSIETAVDQGMVEGKAQGCEDATRIICEELRGAVPEEELNREKGLILETKRPRVHTEKDDEN